MEGELLKLIAAGGDMATIAFLIFAWRTDKRITRLEWQQQSCCEEK